MSLVASLRPDAARPASFLPAIKCSSCGDEVDIALMGDHICGNKSASAAIPSRPTIAHEHLPRVPSPLQQQNLPAAPVPQTRVRAPTISSQPPAKPSRPTLSRINSAKANQPFLAPKSAGPASPISPALSTVSGSSNGGRSRIGPTPSPRIFDPRPPSPELSANLDCAFPPFPAPAKTGSGSRPGTSNGRRTPTHGERTPSRASSRQGGARDRKDTVPMSPASDAGGNMFDKMATSKPGFGDGSKRRPSDQSDASSRMQRRPSLPGLKSEHQPPPIPNEPLPRPSTSQSNRSPSPLPSMTKEGSVKEPPRRPDRPNEDLSFLDHLTEEPVMEMPSIFSPSQPPVPARSVERSRTTPIPQLGNATSLQASQALNKMPSEPQLRGRERRPTLTQPYTSEPSSIPRARERSMSRSGPRIDPRLQDAPPVPKPVQQYKQERTHSPSGSGSSTSSSLTGSSNGASSGPSPVGSAASSIDTFSPLSYEAVQYVEEESLRVPGLNVKSQQRPGERAEQSAARSPPRTFARLSPPKPIAVLDPLPDMPAVVSPPLDSPTDPALLLPRAYTAPVPTSTAQNERPSVKRAQTTPVTHLNLQSPSPHSSEDDYDPFRPVSTITSMPTQTQPKQSPEQLSNMALLPDTVYTAPSPPTTLRPPPSPSSITAQTLPQPPPIPQQSSNPRPPVRRNTMAKPLCRGCHAPITGKSVKAADGRLTGRWHKACFTCHTCAAPFTTADFYVINDQPYCEQHYHEKNGSLCAGCQRGIEGEYLETTSTGTGMTGKAVVEEKFHPRCFTCCECRQVLAEDYFEISGRTYCERHALAAMRSQARLASISSSNPTTMNSFSGAGGPGSMLAPPSALDRRALVAERRTTRLMMMSS